MVPSFPSPPSSPSCSAARAHPSVPNGVSVAASSPVSIRCPGRWNSFARTCIVSIICLFQMTHVVDQKKTNPCMVSINSSLTSISLSLLNDSLPSPLSITSPTNMWRFASILPVPGSVFFSESATEMSLCPVGQDHRQFGSRPVVALQAPDHQFVTHLSSFRRSPEFLERRLPGSPSCQSKVSCPS